VPALRPPAGLRAVFPLAEGPMVRLLAHFTQRNIPKLAARVILSTHLMPIRFFARPLGVKTACIKCYLLPTIKRVVDG